MVHYNFVYLEHYLKAKRKGFDMEIINLKNFYTELLARHEKRAVTMQQNLNKINEHLESAEYQTNAPKEDAIKEYKAQKIYATKVLKQIQTEITKCENKIKEL
jgi:valyl-tRNA synthetase